MNKYNESLYNKLKIKFQDVDKITENYSQSYQDLFILSVLNGQKNGFFLEIGAMHPEIISNTFLLEKKYDWSGIAIEIEEKNKFGNVKEMFEQKRSKTNIIIENALNINYIDLLKKYNAPSVIDYLQLDIEPAEKTLECLYKIPFNEFSFKIITFETEAYYNNATIQKSRDYLNKMGYYLIAKNVCNNGNDPYEDWYVNPKFISKEIISIFESDKNNQMPHDIIFNIN
jgi:hypothetical protein